MQLLSDARLRDEDTRTYMAVLAKNPQLTRKLDRTTFDVVESPYSREKRQIRGKDLYDQNTQKLLLETVALRCDVK